MAKWKLTRQIFGNEEFEITEGQRVTVGRGTNNVIALSSAVISRNHCEINVQNNKALITDLKSSNGVYVGTIKIPPNTPYVIEDSDVIGLGWTFGAPLVNIKDTEKYIFKFNKQNKKSLTSRITFQSDNEFDSIEAKIAQINGNSLIEDDNIKSPVLCSKSSLKRKINTDKDIALHIVKKETDNINNNNDDAVISIPSDSDGDMNFKSPAANVCIKKPKLELSEEEPKPTKVDTKNENEMLEYEAFNVKQEYLSYDEEPIPIESDSDSESEHWLLRLSQSSPGKPFIKVAKSPKSPKLEVRPEDSSYSQMDDYICDNALGIADDEEEFDDDLITIPPVPPADIIDDKLGKNEPTKLAEFTPQDNNENFSDDIISINQPLVLVPSNNVMGNQDEPDGLPPINLSLETDKLNKQLAQIDLLKKAQMIEPLAKFPKSKSNRSSDTKSKPSSSKHIKPPKSSSKKQISHSQKEERKKKLKQLASKDKDVDKDKQNQDNLISTKPVTNVKMTSSNRGAFLTDIAQAVVKPVKRKDSTSKTKDNNAETSPKLKSKVGKTLEDIENKKKETEKSKRNKSKESTPKSQSTKQTDQKALRKSSEIERVPLKSLKPLTDSEETVSGKPFSKVGPVQNNKIKKRVRFSDAAPQVQEFEIEPGNRMTKTNSIKHTLIDYRRAPTFSLEKITLMKILRWNPQWLDEQINNKEPPPILGHNNIPLTVFHSFVNHNQYVQLIGDLLLMEIWECLTMAYMKIRNNNNGIQMRIESVPPIPTQERCYDLFSISVNISLPSGIRNVPRAGEILLVTFGPENSYHRRFFYVNNVRTLPSPPNSKNSFYSISLHATYTDKMALLRPGELMIGKPLTYINNELTLFEAMEYLAGSPLSEAILKPEPHHFLKYDHTTSFSLHSQWTSFLNPSQLAAVSSSVSAALSDKPSLQMVQGPPGTGKSSVICAIVMTYFYNEQGKKQQNRGKLLICATSNAAVDGLVVRLLNLRQSLPKLERFRMVRVGRAEAMHALAADVSSQQLARRQLARHHDAPEHTPGLNEEISHIEARINMWKAAALDAKDPVRVAYCQGKAAECVKRITLLRSGTNRGSTELRPDQIAHEERRIIEGADIVVTTLSSAQQFKMRGLKRRIALCIIDEAGQVIEPETLIPLTLDVTKLTLIGDPQQLPGFICSQRAKQHGLSESLFSRLSVCAEQWAGGSPVLLLTEQYRMHRDIADYPSRAFYGSKISSAPPLRPPLPVPPYSVLSISSGDKGQGSSGANETEAWAVTRLVVALDTLLRPLKLKLAVITPYNAHKELIKKNLKLLQNAGEEPVEVNTVDSFQGQERDVVVVSLARSQGVGFLTDAGRLNVMLTRARHALLLALNPTALLKNPQWRTLIEDAQKRNMFRVLPSKMCTPITATQVPNDEILKYVTDQKSHR